MNKEQLLEQKEKLEDYINLGVCPEKDYGLCDNVLLEFYDYWDDVFRSWFNFSGSVAFPIEGGHDNYNNNKRKHDRRTRYGVLRLSLAKHCLQHVLNELEKRDE
jgi:hypothetical protein